MESSENGQESRGLLRVYVAGIVLLAALAVAATGPGFVPARLDTLGVLAGLAALAGARPVRFPWFRVQLTVTHPFIFLAIAELGDFEAVLVALSGLAVTVFSQRGTRRFIRFVFNVGSVVLSTVLAAWAFRELGGRPSGALFSDFWPLTAAGAVYFLANTGLLTVAVGLERRGSMLGVWRDGFQWTAASYFTGLTVAVLLLALVQAFGPWSLALGIPPCWLLVSFYETHREILAERERRIEEIERMNAGLELKVAERTRELEEANRRLVEANERILEASRAKSEFIANVSHELRTPLNAVIGFSEFLAGPDFDNLTSRQKGFLADIRDSGEHLLQLINDLLDFSKIEAGKTEIHRETVSFEELLREVAAMLRPQAERKDLALAWSCAMDIGFVDLDPKLIKQVLVNLLSNAVKFTPERGHVEVLAIREGADLVFEVVDDGIGIPAEHLPRVFEEFHQVDGSYARKHQGTGLGLALVRRMVAMHGGSVSVRSTPGRGSTFSCRIPGACVLAVAGTDLPEIAPTVPIAAAKAPPPPEVPAPPRHEPGRGTILVVEDNEVSRKLARNVLRSRGYEVLEAASGEQALEILESARPDLVLMDIQLPGLDGLEVTRRIKSDGRLSRVRIVALSAHGAGMDESRAREAGCEGYLTKPIRLALFPAQVAAYLEGVA